MNIVISSRAKKELRKINKFNQIAIAQKVRKLENCYGEEKLSGYDKTYRVRVGDYRIVYKKDKKEIKIVLIGHRKEIYDLLRRLF